MIFNHAVYENEVTYSLPVLSVCGIHSFSFVPLTMTVIAGEIRGPLFSGDVTHRFHYTAEQCDKVLEAVYRFPLPGDAAVTGISVWFGDTEIEAILKERQEGETDYQEAKRQGQQAALATRESPDVFTLQIAGLKPDQEVYVQTFFVQMAESAEEGWKLRLPLTVAPRFARNDEQGVHANGNPLALALDPGHRFSLAITGFDLDDIYSDTHRLALRFEDGEVALSLQAEEEIANQDCVIRYKTIVSKEQDCLRVYTYDEGGRRYFLALAGSAAAVDEISEPREVILLIDHSGSMEGEKWVAADKAATELIGRLTDKDFFNVGIFHDDSKWFNFRQTESATLQNKQRACQFINRNKTSGGTELGIALEQALSLPRTAGVATRHIILITDGQVSDFARLLQLADEEGKLSDRRSIHVVSIDLSPNALLARQLASRTGGKALFLTSQEQLQGDLQGLIDELSQPLTASGELTININACTVANYPFCIDANQMETSIPLGGLPVRRPVWISGLVASVDGVTAKLTVRDREVASGEIKAQKGNPAIKYLFGAARLMDLEFLYESRGDIDNVVKQLHRLGYRDMANRIDGYKDKVYQENRKSATEAALKELLTRESLRYGVVCSATAFVAVKKESGTAIAGTVVIANAWPAGWNKCREELYDADDQALTSIVQDLELSVQSYNCLKRAGINTCSELAPSAKEEMMKVRNLGKKSLEEVKRKLIELNLSLTENEEDEKDDEKKTLYSGYPNFVKCIALLTTYKASKQEKILNLRVIVNWAIISRGDELRIIRNHDGHTVAVLRLDEQTTMDVNIDLQNGDELRFELVSSRKKKWPFVEVVGVFMEI